MTSVSVLFLCTGNSARSILAEAILNNRSIGTERFRAYSAGSHPKGQVNPFALECLETHHVSIDGLRSKSWDEFAGPEAPTLDFIVTVCDQAAAEACPYWPGHPATAHWGMPDPAAVEGGDEAKRRAFRETFEALQQRIDRFVALPFDTLSRPAIVERAREIGRQ